MDALPGPFADLHFLRAGWLWALFALPVLAWWWHRRRVQGSPWRTTVDRHLLPHLLDANPGHRGMLGALAAACAYVVAVVALAGPAWQQVAQPTWQVPAPLVVALDLSSASSAPDLPPSRLLQARAKLDALFAERTGGQVGLVAYAGDAFTVAPLTDDAANVALFLDALDPTVMPVDGQRADRAIEWSARLLRQAGFDHGDILLLTDHADADVNAAAVEARAQGFRVSALGLGTPAGAAYRTRAGSIEQARLDTASLQALAGAGGGGYATLARDLSDLRALHLLDPRIAGDDGVAGGGTDRHWQDGGFWLLPVLMLLALLAFRRGGAVAAVLLLAWLPVRPAAAFEFADLWARPDQQAHERLVRGAEAYRAEQYDRAADAWRGVPGADARYNLGNALAKAGRYQDAIDAYDEALAREPGMADAAANRAAVQALLDRMPPGEGGESEGGEGGEGGDGAAGSPSGGDPPGASGDPSAGPASQGRDEPGSSAQAEAGPADTEAQRAADAAQRERMARALQEPEEGADPEAGDGQPARDAPPGETPAERERRIANEAWLQRVPDDPGGLLRRKFALEYQRRQMEGIR